MNLFRCQSCSQLLAFENVECLRCGRKLAYLPDAATVSAIEPAAAPLWIVAGAGGAAGGRYRLCQNYVEHGVCNWAIPAAEDGDYCRSCRLTQVIPNLAEEKAKVAWARLETAKRRLVYTLLELGLPLVAKADDPGSGLAFSFLGDPADGGEKVMTGHDGGVITVNIAEADDAARERARLQMGEAYRTVLGHLRHESGHYYWERLVKGSAAAPRFRELFGDESDSYEAALERHYASGPPADWPARFVSAYATMHPFEDWAETWAHYLHMTDTLETAQAFGLSLRPTTADGAHPADTAVATRRVDTRSFDDVATAWLPLTYALNSLNRSMGHADLYPFVLPEPALAKLRFVHEVIAGARGRDH